MTGVAIASIIVSAIAAVGGWLSARESRKANQTNVTASGRVEMEKEAYVRARKLDTETIERQDKELKELEAKNEKLEAKLNAVQEQNAQLNEDVERISRDNYQMTRQNQQIIEKNEQVLAENKRLRARGEAAMEDNARLHEEVGVLRQRVTKVQRGIAADSTMPIRERETDTNPMGDYRNG